MRTIDYQPNWQHASTRRRIKHALGFVRAVLSEHTSRSWSTRVIDQYLGQQQKPLSQYLRQQLLVCTDDSYQFGDVSRCKQYQLNLEGYHHVRNCYLGLVQPVTVNQSQEEDQVIVREWITEEFRQQLTTLTFTYEDKSQRLWHPLQNVRREYKKTALKDAGLRYQYDIVCSAPRLIQQLARAQGEDAAMPYLDQYLTDRTAVRCKLAEEAELNPEVVKRIINALLCGAQLSRSDRSSIYDLVDQDPSRIQFLQQHEFVQGLRQDFKTCWDMIKFFVPRTRVLTRRGHWRTRPLSSKQKWFEYFRCERQVLDSVVAYMKRTGNQYFLEHDGWSSLDPIDLDDLKSWVRTQTAFDVEFEEEILC